jgi:methylthioribose-1-phosphate isomerase
MKISKFIQSIQWKKDQLILLDQTLLPEETVFLSLSTIEEVWEAIRYLKVRGAPAIGMTAAYGLYLGVRYGQEENVSAFIEDLEKKSDYLATARPTAVNLFWALKRLKERAYQEQNQGFKKKMKKSVVRLVNMLLVYFKTVWEFSHIAMREV